MTPEEIATMREQFPVREGNAQERRALHRALDALERATDIMNEQSRNLFALHGYRDQIAEWRDRAEAAEARLAAVITLCDRVDNNGESEWVGLYSDEVREAATGHQ